MLLYAALFDSPSAQWFFFAAMAVMCLVLLRRSYRYFSRARKANQGVLVKTKRPGHKDRGHHLDLPDEALRWEVEMEEIAREVSARIDTKVAVLRTLIADADRAAQRIEEALTQFQTVERIAEESSAGELEPRSEATLSATGREYEEACTLADYGFSVPDIASRLSLARSQVEAILASRTQESEKHPRPHAP